MTYKFKTNNPNEALRLLKAEDMAIFIVNLFNTIRFYNKKIESEEVESFFADFTQAVYEDFRDLGIEEDQLNS
jgi:hypothetical protein